MSSTTKELLTSTQIAKAIDAHLPRVLHVLETRNIDPVRRIGNTRLYPHSATEIVKEQLDARDLARSRRKS